MKVAICDDDINQLAIIKAAMEDYAIEHTEQTYEIECFDNPLEFLQHSESTGGYDILLLDICMPGIFDEASKGQFICPYKGFIVNHKSIQGIEPDKITLKNGKEIPIVKRNFAAIKQQYFRFMFTREGE